MAGPPRRRDIPRAPRRTPRQPANDESCRQGRCPIAPPAERARALALRLGRASPSPRRSSDSEPLDRLQHGGARLSVHHALPVIRIAIEGVADLPLDRVARYGGGTSVAISPPGPPPPVAPHAAGQRPPLSAAP